MKSHFARNHPLFLYRVSLLVSLLLTVGLGLASKFYRGLGQGWLNNSLGGVFYEIFWVLALVLVMVKLKPLSAAIGVFVMTSILEILQLWHPPFLEAMRATFMGRMILGTTFVWSDFFYYVVGCAIAWAWVRYLQHQFLPKK